MNKIEQIFSGVFASIYVFFLPVWGLILLVGLFIAADTISGIWCAIKLKEEIKSRTLSRVVTKMFVYSSIVFVLYVFDVYILSHFFDRNYLTVISTGVLCFIEAFSVDEKIRKVNKEKGARFFLNRALKFIKEVKGGVNEVFKQEKYRENE